MPHVVPYMLRVRMFRDEVTRDLVSVRERHGQLRAPYVTIRRNHILTDGELCIMCMCMCVCVCVCVFCDVCIVFTRREEKIVLNQTKQNKTKRLPRVEPLGYYCDEGKRKNKVRQRPWSWRSWHWRTRSFQGAFEHHGFLKFKIKTALFGNLQRFFVDKKHIKNSTWSVYFLCRNFSSWQSKVHSTRNLACFAQQPKTNCIPA